MEDNNTKYRICPPKLNETFVVLFWSIPELLAMAGLFMLGVTTKDKGPLFVMAMIAVFQFRPPTDIGCLSQYCRKLLNYCTSSQTLETFDNRKEE